jgi:hypothetical protein
MENDDRALKRFAATPELWGAVYMMLIFTVSERAFHSWQRLAGKPIRWDEAAVVGIDLLVCPVPLLMGLAFRRLLRREARDGLLNARIYRVCNFWIAQLLVLAYVTMVL